MRGIRWIFCSSLCWRIALFLGIISLCQSNSSPADSRVGRAKQSMKNTSLTDVLKLLSLTNKKPTRLSNGKLTSMDKRKKPKVSSGGKRIEGGSLKGGAKNQDAEEQMGIEIPNESCGQMYNLSSENTPLKLSSLILGNEQYPAGVKCNWTFVGSSLCKPSITCKTIDMRETADCSEDYIEITDGVGSFDRFCSSKDKVENLCTSGKSVYLFVKFLTSQSKTFKREFKGFECEISCNNGKNFLPKSEYPFKEDKNCICGLQRKSGRVVGGKDATFREFPWLVAIVMAGTRSPMCGASIINSRWVLCAAHCFPPDVVTIDMFEILANAHLLNVSISGGILPVDKPLGQFGSIRSPGYKLPQKTDKDEGSIRRKAKRIVIHPLFMPNFDFDVALLELDEPIDFNGPDSPVPICLPQIDEPRDPFDGLSPTIAGWGLADASAGTTTRLLQKVEVAQIALKDCTKWLEFEVTERMICAGYMAGGKDACTGDSGGPLIIRNMKKNQFTQIGIVSSGAGCAKKHSPGIYSKVSELLPWILFNSEGGTWCKRKTGARF